MNMLYNKNRKRRKETEGLKKRIFVLITAVAMLGFVLVGCGSAKKSGKGGLNDYQVHRRRGAIV